MAKAIVKAFSLGKLSALAQGGGVPNGEYQCTFSIVMHKGEKSPVARPGLQATFKPMRGGEPIQWFYGFGTGMEKVWAPNAEGTGIVPLAGVENVEAPKAGSNYGIFLKEAYNAGLPENFYDDDCSVLNPCNVAIKNIPEPEERKGFAKKANSAEGAGVQEDDRVNRTIAVISAFLDGGKPWEGEVAEIKAVKPNGKANGKAAVAAAAPDTEADPEAALNEALGEVLKASPDGCSKVQLNQKVFAHITTHYGDEMAQMIMTDILSVPAELAAVLANVGMKVSGFKVVPA